MTKSELKPGYVVKYRNGELRMVMPRERDYIFLAIGESAWSDLFAYTEDLLNTYNNKFDVMEVYGPSEFAHSVWIFNEKHRKLLWKRSEKKKYTYAQLREILGEEFEVVG